MDQKITNPNDFKVVEFFNSTDFDFTPELGAMFDGRPLFVGSGEKRQFPYHIGHRLATNLAKAVLVKGAPLHNPADSNNNPVGTPLWSETALTKLKESFLTELYVENAPIRETETDRLFKRVQELEDLFKKTQESKPADAPKTVVKSVAEMVAPQTVLTPKQEGDKTVYKDKQEVIAELEKRGIQHNKRLSKENLEKLLA